MDYVIKNPKNVFIQLNENGRPVTCTEHNKGIFEYSKAKNICDNLPKTLKQLRFCVEAIPDIPQKPKENKVIEINTYQPSENIIRWINRFDRCCDDIEDAVIRRKELDKELSNVDKEFLNIVHRIEAESKVNMYIGWQERNEIKSNREKRRDIKDEMLILETILNENVKNLKKEKIKKSVDGLSKRKYTYRVVEEDENINVV